MARGTLLAGLAGVARQGPRLPEVQDAHYDADKKRRGAEYGVCDGGEF